MSAAAIRRVERNLRVREQRREAIVGAEHSEFCAVCHYYASFCRCAGARLFLRAEVLRLRAPLDLRKPLSKTMKRKKPFQTTAILHSDGWLEVMGGPMREVKEMAVRYPGARAMVVREAAIVDAVLRGER